MNPIAELYRLQEIDTAWEKIRQRILQLQKFSGGSAQLLKAREQAKTAETELNETRKQQREAESEANSLTERIQDADALLMGGQVRNPKELEALQSSVESMRRHKSALDDRGVEAMVKADELGVKFAAQSEALDAMETEWAAKEKAIEDELVRRKKEYAYLKNVRTQAIKSISPKFLDQYEYLRGRKNGIAVAKLEEDSCGACHMQLPVGIIGNVRRSADLVLCTACGRILYAE